MLVALVIVIIFISTHHSDSPTVATTNSSTNVVVAQTNSDKENEQKTQKLLDDNFKSTSWYGLIKKIEFHGDSVDVYTSIYPDKEGRAAAKQLGDILFGNITAEVTKISSLTIDCNNGGNIDPVYTRRS
ncbi:hypothetical protein [Alicyclobacillus fodiniaquatilis]|uniref:Uncharacterized protein n=1 Tax=Alicyclobacillus fodiniaquatilis TaxID=1661150 RepID=A0ABW4JI35_9BACL